MKTFITALTLGTALTFAPGAFAADDYTFDASHSQIVFSYDHLGFSTTYGLISGFDGKATIDAEDLSNSKVEVTFPIDMFSTGWEKREQHFLSADFFDAATNPSVSFVSKSVEATGDKTAKITGDLTMAGTTKEVVLDATLNKIGEHPISKKPWAGMNATTVLKRSDFGVEKFAPYVSDEVNVTISVEMEKVGS